MRLFRPWGADKGENMQHLDRSLKFGIVAVAMASLVPSAQAATKQVERGRYLVTVIGCTDCHTPGALTGKPDMTRYLAGSDVGFQLPDLGTFVPPNLTPDKETGIGKWTKKQIITAFTTGKDPEGRELAPIMPWRDFAHLTKADANAIASYLKTLKPIKHKVHEPFGPKDKVPILIMTVVPGSGMAQK